MTTVTVQKDQFKKVLDDVEVLLDDIAVLLNQDDLAKRRLADMRKNSSTKKSEKDLDVYMRARGV